jgi:hypothetical protein
MLHFRTSIIELHVGCATAISSTGAAIGDTNVHSLRPQTGSGNPKNLHYAKDIQTSSPNNAVDPLSLQTIDGRKKSQGPPVP